MDFMLPPHLVSAQAAIPDLLNKQLANLLDLHNHVKMAHWNLRGPLFALLHPLFGEYAGSLNGYADEIAERVVMLEFPAKGSTQDITHSCLPPYPECFETGTTFVRDLVASYGIVLHELKELQHLCNEHDDLDTLDLLTKIIAGMTKQHWYLKSTIM